MLRTCRCTRRRCRTCGSCWSSASPRGSTTCRCAGHRPGTSSCPARWSGPSCRASSPALADPALDPDDLVGVLRVALHLALEDDLVGAHLDHPGRDLARRERLPRSGGGSRDGPGRGPVPGGGGGGRSRGEWCETGHREADDAGDDAVHPHVVPPVVVKHRCGAPGPSPRVSHPKLAYRRAAAGRRTALPMLGRCRTPDVACCWGSRRTRSGARSPSTGRSSSRPAPSRSWRTGSSGPWSPWASSPWRSAAAPAVRALLADRRTFTLLALAAVVVTVNWGDLHLGRQQRPRGRDVAGLLHQPAGHRADGRLHPAASGSGRCSGSPWRSPPPRWGS